MVYLYTGPVNTKKSLLWGYMKFHTYCEVFIVGIHEIVMHVWNIRNVYVFLDNNVEIEGN
jgi:hypothetical protein